MLIENIHETDVYTTVKLSGGKVYEICHLVGHHFFVASNFSEGGKFIGDWTKALMLQCVKNQEGEYIKSDELHKMPVGDFLIIQEVVSNQLQKLDLRP